jgi:hypothetical protein
MRGGDDCEGAWTLGDGAEGETACTLQNEIPSRLSARLVCGFLPTLPENSRSVETA